MSHFKDRRGSNNPNFRHGLSKHPAYKRWADMVGRCTNPEHPYYDNYGGRGITVCNQWRTFAGFWVDMQDGYSRELTLDRQDNNGGYNPTNCRWISNSENCRNKRNNIWIDTPRGRMTAIQAATSFHINPATLYSRIANGREPLVNTGRWPK